MRGGSNGAFDNFVSTFHTSQPHTFCHTFKSCPVARSAENEATCPGMEASSSKTGSGGAVVYTDRTFRQGEKIEKKQKTEASKWVSDFGPRG